MDDRIISTIRIHIEANQIAVGVHIYIRIQEPSPLGIIVSRLQIIQPGFGITDGGQLVALLSAEQNALRDIDYFFFFLCCFFA